ncbi:hypothetical protein [Tateyamaria sp. SN6-1]|uniref:hypothetical protein n=1 Tax=Tateyamaria sp. SN6-1 TaxID=3092148 RepID=UPI0039F63DBC
MTRIFYPALFFTFAVPSMAAAQSPSCDVMLSNNLSRNAAAAIFADTDIEGDAGDLNFAIAASRVLATREGCASDAIVVDADRSKCSEDICRIESSVGYFLVHVAETPSDVLVFWARYD